MTQKWKPAKKVINRFLAWKGLYQIWPRGLLWIILWIPIKNFLPDSLGWFWHIWGMLNRCRTPIFSHFYAKKCFFFKNDGHEKSPQYTIEMKMMVMWSHEFGISVTSHDHLFPYSHGNDGHVKSRARHCGDFSWPSFSFQECGDFSWPWRSFFKKIQLLTPI